MKNHQGPMIWYIIGPAHADRLCVGFWSISIRSNMIHASTTKDITLLTSAPQHPFRITLLRRLSPTSPHSSSSSSSNWKRKILAMPTFAIETRLCQRRGEADGHTVCAQGALAGLSMPGKAAIVEQKRFYNLYMTPATGFVRKSIMEG